MTALENSKKINDAIQYGSFSDMKKLLDEGIDINDTDYEGRTALMMYSVKGNIDAVLELITLGADINQIFLYQGRMKKTALDAARETGKKAIVEILLNNGAKSGDEISES